jgi:DNA polymerase V
MFALIDCNNFFASCERLFRPDLRDKPLIVLSGNDGCVIARSNEAKALGIAMGEPYYKIKGLCQRQKVQVFSSNHSLYTELSQRIMRLIEQEWPHMAIYSIDEAFLDLSSMQPSLQQGFCERLQKKIVKDVGIPTSIGIGPTKTLAKAANFLCKKVVKTPVLDISQQRHWLEQVSANDVWGIGSKSARRLEDFNIHTAQDLANLSLSFIKRHFNVGLVRTIMELQGTACSGLAEPTPRQSIISSKSFDILQKDLSYLAAAVSGHCAYAARKIRKSGLVAKRLSVFIHSSPFRQDLTYYASNQEWVLVNPSDDTIVLTKIAKLCLNKIFKPGIYYKKVGIMLHDLVDKSQLQMDLFHQPEEAHLVKQDKLMGVLDNINRRYGRHTLQLAAAGGGHRRTVGAHKLSPCYTTCWSQLPRVSNRT